MIMSPAHAQQMVDYFQFSAPADHADRTLILMIERIEAVDSLPEILRIPGVDAYMVAPVDLALSMGEPVAAAGSTAEDRRGDRSRDQDDRRRRQGCGARIDFETVPAFVEKGVTLLYTHADHMLAAGAQQYSRSIVDRAPQPQRVGLVRDWRGAALRRARVSSRQRQSAPVDQTLRFADHLRQRRFR